MLILTERKWSGAQSQRWLSERGRSFRSLYNPIATLADGRKSREGLALHLFEHQQQWGHPRIAELDDRKGGQEALAFGRYCLLENAAAAKKGETRVRSTVAKLTSNPRQKMRNRTAAQLS